jgi:hypothetical protein
MNPDDDRRTAVRWRCVIAFVFVAALLSGCGGDSTSSPPGSPDKPLVAQQTSGGSTSGRKNEASSAAPKAAAKPGYQSLVEHQGSKPRSRFTPCNLVTKAQAQAIVGAPIHDPLEAPRGPTCIYRTQDGKSFITLAVQPLEFSKLKRKIHKREPVNISSASAFCGVLGNPVVYVSLPKHRVLSVGAPCDVGRRFATTALGRLQG